ncbi:hypothetical protein K0U00_43220, partial [Paenibacillus sepulcri]|nr:hypothetical protein [Paenibacillus sepulcri]
IVFINQNDIARLFHRLVAKNGGFAYIRDNQGHMIAPAFSAGMSVDMAELPGNYPEKSGSSFETLNDTKMLVSHMESDQNGWTFVAAVPASVVLAKAEYIKRMILAITSVILGIGIIAALWMAYRNSKPLSELTASLRELSSRMERQLPLLRASVLERLLKGYYKEEEQARADLAEGRILLPEDAYFAVTVSVHKETMDHGSFIDTDEAQALILSRIERLMEGFHYGLNMNADNADLIVSLPAPVADADRERLK